MAALREAGVRVVEHHADVWPDTASKLAATRAVGVPRAWVRQVRAWARLARPAQGPARAVIVGSTAHLDVWLARREARRQRAPLLFDPLVSVVETARDRDLWQSPRLLRRAASLEGRLFRMADATLADSAAHARAWSTELGVPLDRFQIVPAGAPPEFRTVPEYRPRGGRLRVAYFGQFIPLHGVQHIIEAAALMRDMPVDFVLAGRGQTLGDARRLAQRLGLENVEFQECWRTPEELANDVLETADVCLGAFADLPKTDRVVPFKVYAAMAAGRAVVTGDTQAVRELLRAGVEVRTVPCANPEALARAIGNLAERPAERAALAGAGRSAYDRRFASAPLGRALIEIIEGLERALQSRRTEAVAGVPAS
jgi:glycosyltransferase involved in cell wall biosynthesis